MMKKLLSAAALTVALAIPSTAATLNGKFAVIAINAKNQSTLSSEATAENARFAYDQAVANVDGYEFDIFDYSGDLDFSSARISGFTSITSWLATGLNGTVNNLDGAFGGLELSKGNINNGTATTTFFAFILLDTLFRSDFTINHDDGVGVYDLDGVDLATTNPDRVGGFVGPNSVRETTVNGFNGGSLGILYVATNSNPSVLKVDVATVPVPAAGFLLIGALGGLVALRRRKTA
ncbi:MAG: VPLPA-CTERM sorting domain-containing protein [Rhodobacteraceae bacterium]|nr:VPLPA-CTERM sorting domain-containing protein [Paracoccaceae bacterium]